MARIRVGEESFNVVVEGGEASPALLISNSLGTNLYLWDALMPALSRHFRVIRYDSRGHGQSDAPRSPYSIWRLGRDALAILDALGVEKAHFLGLSMGGMVGQWLLANAPDRIGRAVLANTAAVMPPPDQWNMRIRMARENGMAAIAPMVANLWFPKAFQDRDPAAVARIQAMLAATPAHGYAACCAALRDMDQRETIRSIVNPVLVIGGRHDQSTPPERSRAIADAIPGAKFLLLETGHLSNVEAPDEFAKAVIGFLTTKEPAAKKPKPKPPEPAPAIVSTEPPEPAPAPEPPATPVPKKRKPAKKAAAKKAWKAAKPKAAAKKPKKSTNAGSSKSAGKKKAAGKKAGRRATGKTAAKKPAKKAVAKKAARKSSKKPAKKPVKKTGKRR